MNWEKLFRSRAFWIWFVVIVFAIIVFPLGGGYIYLIIGSYAYIQGLYYWISLVVGKDVVNQLLNNEIVQSSTVLLSLVGWVLFVIFLAKIKNIDKKTLRIIGIALILFILLTAVGCTQIWRMDLDYVP